MTEQEIRLAVKEAGIKMLEHKLVQGTWGNISNRMDEKHMVVTPSGRDYIRVKPEEMVVVNIETMEYVSDIKPTSEKKLHAAIYRARPEINAVMHSHPLWCSSVAAARKTLPVMSEEMGRLVKGEARTGAYGLPGTKKLTTATMEALGDRNACFLANHGMVCCATSIEECFEVAKIMEESSKKFLEETVMKQAGAEAFSMEDLEVVFRRCLMK